MKGAGSNSVNKSKKGEGQSSRYVWSKNEEDWLIECLKELKAKGWKADNSFKAGYLLQLENMMSERFPLSDLRAEKQIKSKLTVWKKQYSMLFTLFNTSGAAASYDPKTKTIHVETEDFWKSYIRVNLDVDKLRKKTFPYFEEWSDVFGTDRSTGEGAEDITAALLDVNNNPGQYGNGIGRSNIPVIVDDSSDDDNKKEGVENQDKVESSKKSDVDKKGKKPMKFKKRKYVDDGEDSKAMIQLLDKFVTNTGESLDKIGIKFAPSEPIAKDPLKEQRDLIYDEVEKMTELSEDKKTVVVHKLIHDAMDGEMFLKLKQSAKKSFICMLLGGNGI